MVICICYIFSVPTRRSSVRSELAEICSTKGIISQWEEYELLSENPADPLGDRTWSQLLRRTECGAYHVILAAPPCEQHSRALFSGTAGPRPLRNRQPPNGLPNIRRIWERKTVERNNRLHDRTRQLVLAGHNAARRASWLIEFPEDLGSHKTENPATFWDHRAKNIKEDTGATSIAFRSCEWGVPYAKPERTMSTLTDHTNFRHGSWPQLDRSWGYGGHLGKSCPHDRRPQLICKDANGKFTTSKAAA